MTRCRSCNAAIRWAVTSKGKRMPLDEQPQKVALPVGQHNGDAVIEIRTAYTPHWATCPDANQHRRKT